ncbi:unnamed protein product [Paramecium pentaurelia]|uniref:Transmembrane protein n=1 Tax=Paramecium pentaurelia TaxID=43138 RepID=A0A8S1VXM2_9CILI|nr:unnamed protein product [Paramecium pentaurelia]
MLQQLFPFLFIFSLIKCQTLESLDVSCKQDCKNIHIVKNGSLFWREQTLVDDQKEFLQLTFDNLNPKQSMNLKLELTEQVFNNQSLYEIHPSQINNLTTQKINIIFKCHNDIELQFKLKVEIINSTNQTLIIPFKKQCNEQYFDPTKYSVYLKDLNNENISIGWDNSKPQILQNISAVFEFIPPENQTIYIQNVELNIDNNNTKSAKDLIKKNCLDAPLAYVSNSKKLIIKPEITCNNISNEKILFHLKIDSFKLKEPFFIYFFKQCDKKDKDLENNQEFPIFIGTKKNTNELFRAGVSQIDYNYTTKSISENTNAFQMFIYFKTKDKQTIQERLFPNGQKIDIDIVTRVRDEEILKIKHQKKLQMNNVDDRKQILLYFECQQQGNSTVYVDIIFNYQKDSHKQASFSFNKFCAKTIQKQEKTLFGEVVYYIICIVAMLFGVQTIRLFTNLIKQDANVPEVTIDTSYKRGYSNIEEEKQIEL